MHIFFTTFRILMGNFENNLYVSKGPRKLLVTLTNGKKSMIMDYLWMFKAFKIFTMPNNAHEKMFVLVKSKRTQI